MAENTGHNAYTLGIVILIIASIIFIVERHEIFERGVDITIPGGDIKIPPKPEHPSNSTAENQPIKGNIQSQKIPNEMSRFFEGDWEITYFIRDCKSDPDREKFADRLTVTYRISLEKIGEKMVGNGTDKTEFYDGRSRDWGQGGIVLTIEMINDLVAYNVIRRNLQTGGESKDKVFFPPIIDLNEDELRGTYTTESGKCWGDVIMKKSI